MVGRGRGGRLPCVASAGMVTWLRSGSGMRAQADEPERKAKPFSSEQRRLYEAEVKPILTQHCLKCHGAGPKIRGGFRLDSREAVLRGGELGPAATPGDPSSSLLIKAINYVELEMPPAGKLPAREIEILTRWVKEGLPWTPDPSAASTVPAEATNDRAARAPPGQSRAMTGRCAR